MASKTARGAALALAGLAVTSGAVVGMAGTAQAAAPAQQTGSVAKGGGWDNDNDGERVAGVFRSYRQCQWAGYRGERYGAWEDFDCDYIHSGWRGQWRSQWGSPFNRSWHGGGWEYRGIWVLRVDDCD